MSRQPNHIDYETVEKFSKTHEYANDKVRLIKEIGRLRVQLYQVKFLDNSEERSDFLRNEISTLKLQINNLRAHARHN